MKTVREIVESWDVGDTVAWKSINGVRHVGRFKEKDSNVIVIDCETCGKECCYEG